MIKIQTKLKELGLYTGKVDGINGPITKAAVRAFQRINGLYVDGIVGPDTLAAFNPPSFRVDDTSDLSYTVKPSWPYQRDVSKYYGAVGTNQTTLILPYKMKIAWDLRKNVSKFSIHEKVHDSAKRCFERVANEYTEEQRKDLGLDLFGGCLNVRPMRGGSAFSMHSWGIAIDFDPSRNQLRWNKSRARLARPDAVKFWQIWEDEGWVSLGRARDYDWMHVQAARL